MHNSLQIQFQAQFDLAKTYVVAVSGGLDSVVLLDMMARIGGLKIIVAHFDHQIRGEESARDAQFVRNLAKEYGFDYQIAFGNLGATASEEKARHARYQFLRTVAQETHGTLCTAHHQDDIVETIALNLVRGTGWRGLAVLGATDVMRPLLLFNKRQLRNYAQAAVLKWREDSTNTCNRYLRNRLRQRLAQSLSQETTNLILDLYRSQISLKQAIEAQCQRFYHPDGNYQRYFWIMIDSISAQELLQFIIRRDFQLSLTRPQLERAVIAIKTHQVGDIVELGQTIELILTKKQFKLRLARNKS